MAAAPVAVAMLALAAASTASTVSAAKKRNKLNQAGTRLTTATANRQEQENLSRGLARQNVVGSTRGIATNSGSLMRQAMTASRNARRGIGLAEGRASLANARSNLAANSTTQQSLIDFGRQAVSFGSTMYKLS